MTTSFANLLRSRRTERRYSQRRLAEDAEVSARHIGFLETGRAAPSRQMVLLLGSALELPLRDRNTLLAAAGFAPAYGETPLDAPELADVLHAIELILRGHEPFPAVVLDRQWNLCYVNEGFARLHASVSGLALPAFRLLGPERTNLIDATFDHYLPFLEDPDEALVGLMPRLQREAAQEPRLAERLARRPLPVVPIGGRSRVVVPIALRLGEASVKLFSTFTSLGTPQDVTTEELRIELLHPADDASAAVLRAAAGG